jgi:hypothetical protein
MVYSSSPYPIYPRIRFINYGPDCPDEGLPMLECAGYDVHFIADFNRRLIRSVKEVDWRVIITREISVVTVGLRKRYRSELKRDLALFHFGHCLSCCLARRGA